MFITMLSANVSVLVVGSIPTGIGTPCKITPGMGLLTETLLIMIFNTNSSYLIFLTSN